MKNEMDICIFRIVDTSIGYCLFILSMVSRMKIKIDLVFWDENVRLATIKSDGQVIIATTHPTPELLIAIADELKKLDICMTK